MNIEPLVTLVMHYFTFIILGSFAFFVVTGVLFEQSKKLFYLSLVLVGLVSLYYILIQTLMTTYSFAPRYNELGSFEPFLQGLGAAALAGVFYGFAGLLTAGIRRLLGKPALRFPLYCAIAFLFGIGVLLVMHHLPCQWTPAGCLLGSPQFPMEAPSVN